MTYISTHNFKKIISKIDLVDTPYDFEYVNHEIHSTVKTLFSKKESKILFATKRLFDNPEEFIKEKFKSMTEEMDDLKFVFRGKKPAYHSICNCKALNADYWNIFMPENIKTQNKVKEFRSWCEQNKYLIEGGDFEAFKFRVKMKFRVDIKTISIENQGYTELLNKSLNQIEIEILDKITALKSFEESSDLNAVVINQYAKCHFLKSKEDDRLINGFENKDVIATWNVYNTTFKVPLYELIQAYYRIKLNPNLDDLVPILDELGFKPCGWCQPLNHN